MKDILKKSLWAMFLALILLLTLAPATFGAEPEYHALGNDLKELDLEYASVITLSSGLPDSYDARRQGYVSSVKDQGDNGLCWSFGMLGAVESNLLKNGYGEQDLSEMHMAYSTSNHSGNTQGFDRSPSDGGNQWMASAYLMRGTPLNGAVTEADDPYSTSILRDRPLPVSEGKDRSYTLQNIYILNSTGPDAADVIKDAVMEFGAVGSAMFMVQERASGGGLVYLNQTNSAYYLDVSPQTYMQSGHYDKNRDGYHAVLIVGWDDDYPAKNFNAAHRPSGNGAWLVKNSWGRDWGRDGYFWISYEDSYFPADPYAVDGVRPYDESETLYLTDPMTYDSCYSTRWKDIYYARSFMSQRTEEVRSVRMFLWQATSRVEVDVIPNFKGFDSGYSFKAKGSVSASFPGWYTIDLNVPVTLNGSGDFAVVAHLQEPNGVRIAADSMSPVPTGTAFLNDGLGFKNVDANLCLRAITVPAEYTEPSVQISIDNVFGPLVTLTPEISGGKVTLGSIAADDLAKLRGNLHVDLTALGQSVKTVVLPSSLMLYGAAKGNHVDSLTVTMDSASLTFDRTAMDMLSGKQGVNDLEISAERMETDRLSDRQREATGGKLYPGVKLTFRTGGKEISSLDGARLAVQIPFTVPDGADVSAFSVWKVKNASLSRLRTAAGNGSLVFRTGTPTASFIIGTERETPYFEDVSNSARYINTVNFVARCGLMNGVDETHFAPESAFTRAMMAQVFFNLERGEQTVSTFSDVTADKWYAGAVGWAQQNGIIGGFEDGTFRPEQHVTVEQLAQMMSNYAAYKNYPVVLATDEIITASSWAQDAYSWITAGDFLESPFQIAGPEEATRAQVATVLAAFLESYEI